MLHSNTDARSSRSHKPGKRALLRNLWALRSADQFEHVKPTHEGLRFGAVTNRGVQPQADVYLPAAQSKGIPSVMLIHGGGFLLGSRSMKPMRYLTSHLLAQGYAVCSIDYRLIFRGGRLEEAQQDARDAWRWWCKKSEEWSLDPEKRSILGLSAGATLAYLTAVAPGQSSPQRLVCGFGLYNFASMNGSMGRLLPRLLTRSPDEHIWQSYSPLNAPHPDCPTLLLHGDADQITAKEQSLDLATRRRELGLKTNTRIYPHAPHGFFNYCNETSATAMEDILRFLEE